MILKYTVDSLRSVFNVFRWIASLGTPNDTPHFSFQEEGFGSMKQKKIIVILWKCFDQIIQAIVVTVICYNRVMDGYG